MPEEKVQKPYLRNLAKVKKTGLKATTIYCCKKAEAESKPQYIEWKRLAA